MPGKQCKAAAAASLTGYFGFVHSKILRIFTVNRKYAIARWWIYTGCPRRNVPNFGRVFLMLKYTDITQNTYVQS